MKFQYPVGKQELTARAAFLGTPSAHPCRSVGIHGPVPKLGKD